MHDLANQVVNVVRELDLEAQGDNQGNRPAERPGSVLNQDVELVRRIVDFLQSLVYPQYHMAQLNRKYAFGAGMG